MLTTLIVAGVVVWLAALTAFVVLTARPRPRPVDARDALRARVLARLGPQGVMGSGREAIRARLRARGLVD